MMRALLLLLVLFGTWCLWSGYFQALLLTFGLVSCLLVVWLCVRLGTCDAEGLPLHLLPRLLLYLPWYLKELGKANVDVARRILDPRLPISPQVFVAPSTQKTDLGRVIYANSITLTPGTVSFQVEPGKIHVHAIAREVRDGLLEGEMDRRVTWLEGES